MDKSAFDLPSNLLAIASAKGTKERKKIKKTDFEIDEILNNGCATLQAKILMLQAAKAVMAGNPKLVKKVMKLYKTLCLEMGVEYDVD